MRVQLRVPEAGVPVVVCRGRDPDNVHLGDRAIPGIDGILAVVGGRIGLWGQLPPLVRNEDAATGAKITRDLHAG